ncbi:MAG: type I-A CRISPR-associated protein Cas4/Csa1 [archaeon]|nr:type I-A CRISPR-associated protein Cas4/Csa1 [archaeon]
MYFLTELEHKMLLHRLLPLARQVGVSPELRGWNWYQPPLKPYYDVKIPMYSVCSKYCPNDRDVYLAQVKKVKPILNFRVTLGKILHGVVSDALQGFMRGGNISFEEWWKKIRWEGLVGDRELLKRRAKQVWDFVEKNYEAQYANLSATQPYASDHDLMKSSMPFLIEHKISGELLGLSGLLSLDCYDYLRCIMFDLKVDDKQEDWHRLFPVGYAIVFESVHEVPVDVCCVLYLSFINEKLVIKKDVFFSNNELRSWWIEERDHKLEIVALKKDPGIPNICNENCIYYKSCRSE